MEPLGADNAWIASIKGAKQRLHALPAVIIAFIAIGFALLAAPLLYAGVESPPDTDPLPAALSRAVLYLLIFTPLYLCAVLSRIWEKRASIRAEFAGFRGLVLGAAVGSLLFLLVVLAASFAGLLQVPAGGANDDLLIGVTFATFLTVFQSYGEELFFRGWLQPILATEWGLLVGLGVSSVLFALAHWVTQDVGALAVFNIGLAGLMFGLMALRTGGLATPFAAHATWNWLEQSGLGLAPNPGVDGLGALIDLDLVGSNVLSGGTDGLNGSLLVTCVLALAVVAFLSPVFVKDPADRLQRRS